MLLATLHSRRVAPTGIAPHRENRSVSQEPTGSEKRCPDARHTLCVVLAMAFKSMPPKLALVIGVLGAACSEGSVGTEPENDAGSETGTAGAGGEGGTSVVDDGGMGDALGADSSADAGQGDSGAAGDATIPGSCSNSVRDPGEADTDCGGMCPMCPPTFIEGFENFSLKPPWGVGATNQLGDVVGSSEQALVGAGSLKSYLGLTTDPTSGKLRAELQFNGSSQTPKFRDNGSIWGTRWAMFVPSDFVADPTQEELHQYKGFTSPGDTIGNPPWSIGLTGKTLHAWNRTQNKSPVTSFVLQKFPNILSIVPGKWHYFVEDIRWDYNPKGKGFVKLYASVGSWPSAADLVVDYVGATGFNQQYGAYFKLGVYKYDWANASKFQASSAAGVKERRYYFDEVAFRKDGTFLYAP